jgi:hypothetical protein
MTWTDDGVNGSYFTILKSGIWSINFTYWFSAGGTIFVDASTNFTGGVAQPITTGAGELIVCSQQVGAGTNFAPVSFLGYLGSNATRYYRFNTNMTPGSATQSNVRPYLNIVLLYETPNITPTFP